MADIADFLWRLQVKLSALIKFLFAWVVRALAPDVIPLVERIKGYFGCKTYHVENGFVLLCLVLVTFATGTFGDMWRWIEVAAVYYTFVHASISQRMEERQRLELAQVGRPSVPCFYKLEPIFIRKEALWFATFLHAELYGALALVCIFLMMYPWREAWRAKHPLAA